MGLRKQVPAGHEYHARLPFLSFLGAVLAGLASPVPAMAHASSELGERTRVGRFSGYVADRRSHPRHSFRAGEPVALTFVDRRRRYTTYQVCWGRRGKPSERCWFRLSGRRGEPARAYGFLLPASRAPGSSDWYVGSRLVARWSFASRRR